MYAFLETLTPGSMNSDPRRRMFLQNAAGSRSRRIYVFVISRLRTEEELARAKTEAEETVNTEEESGKISS